jgi:hypothetical protein
MTNETVTFKSGKVEVTIGRDSMTIEVEEGFYHINQIIRWSEELSSEILNHVYRNSEKCWDFIQNYGKRRSIPYHAEETMLLSPMRPIEFLDTLQRRIKVEINTKLSIFMNMNSDSIYPHLKKVEDPLAKAFTEWGNGEKVE